ncbi:MAG: group 1 glycosyl transferase [Fibrobacteres bacterium]|nr:group 1 glycosyl transferase [Fibrobacterota bacterium]
MIRSESVLFLLSRVLGGKTFSSHLMRVVETMTHIQPHFVFLEEEDYGRYRQKIPSWNRLSGLFVGPSILRWKLRRDPPPASDKVFVQSFELIPALQEVDPLAPAILAHDSTNVLSYRLIRDTSPGPGAKLLCGLKSLLVTPNYKSVIGRARAFLPRTHWCARSLVTDFGVEPERIIVAPSGIDTQLWSPDWSRVRGEPPILLWVGNDFARKGGEFLLEVFTRFLFPRARLRIVSNDPAIKGRAWPAGVEHLHGLGHGNPAEIVDAYRSADIFVFPTRKEHMGMVLTEACATGLPIVATDVGGVREAVREGKNGILLPYGAGAEEWASAILDLLADPVKRERFGVYSRAIAENEFSFGVLRERVKAAFAKLA